MTSTVNPEVTMSLEEAVGEVLVVLTGQTLTYDSSYDRFRSITQHLNRALRSNALENEWAHYVEQINFGSVKEGDREFDISANYRFRVIGDDAVRLLNSDGVPVMWAHILPRDALHKYRNRDGLWASVTKSRLLLSRPIRAGEEGHDLEVTVMREPRVFVLPGDAASVVDPAVLEQQVDFEFPDLITARAAWLYAQTDPVMQPRVQTLEDSYKTLMYQLIERDTAYTESPYLNEFILPVQNSIYPDSTARPWPVSNRR